jgi:hypothetical protein
MSSVGVNAHSQTFQLPGNKGIFLTKTHGSLNISSVVIRYAISFSGSYRHFTLTRGKRFNFSPPHKRKPAGLLKVRW